MGIKVNFAEVPDSQEFGTLPLGRYPTRMRVSAYQVDAQKELMTDADGHAMYWQTKNGDAMWKIQMEILDGPYKDREIFDQLVFSPGGLKRVKVIYVRGGFAGETDTVDLEPEDLDGSYWWVDVDRHEPASDGNAVKESKYTFQRKGCACETCVAYDGKKVNVNARIAFAGFAPMKAAEAKQFASGAGPSVDGACPECAKGVHTHKQGEKGCPCPNETHLPF